MKALSDSIISKVGFWQGLVIATISIICTIATVSVLFGGSLARLAAVEKQSEKTETSLQVVKTEINDRLSRIEEKMVNKDDFKELKSDVKDLVKKSK